MAASLHSPETCGFDQLPEDVLLLILSFLPTLAEIARTSLLNRRWRYIWYGITRFDFDATTMRPENLWATSTQWFIAWVNKVIEARVAFPGLPSVKELQIQLQLFDYHGQHIDRWIDFAVANPVETLELDFSPCGRLIGHSQQYKLCEEPWYRAPSGLSNIKYLNSLYLSFVNVTKQFVEFILSSCPLLEDLSLSSAGTFSQLSITGSPPLRLRRLKIIRAGDFAVTELCAPNLTYFNHESKKFNPRKIHTPKLTDLTIGGRTWSQPIEKYLDHFWTYLAQLEKLQLIMYEPQEFRLKQIPQLGKLKYLKVFVNWDTDPIFCRIIDFIKACPVIETFAFEFLVRIATPEQHSIRQQENKQIWWRNVDKSCSFDCLKVVELYRGDGQTIDQELVKCIISKSPNLEKLNIVTCFRPKPNVVKVVEAKAQELCHGCPRKVEINVC